MVWKLKLLKWGKPLYNHHHISFAQICYSKIWFWIFHKRGEQKWWRNNSLKIRKCLRCRHHAKGYTVIYVFFISHSILHTHSGVYTVYDKVKKDALFFVRRNRRTTDMFGIVCDKIELFFTMKRNGIEAGLVFKTRTAKVIRKFLGFVNFLFFGIWIFLPHFSESKALKGIDKRCISFTRIWTLVFTFFAVNEHLCGCGCAHFFLFVLSLKSNACHECVHIIVESTTPISRRKLVKKFLSHLFPFAFPNILLPGFV